MKVGAYSTVFSCFDCPKIGTELRHQRKLELFLPNGPLEFVAIDILGSIPRTRSGNKFVVVITGKYFKLTQVIPTTNITSSEVANFFQQLGCSVEHPECNLRGQRTVICVQIIHVYVYILRSEKAHSHTVSSSNQPAS